MSRPSVVDESSDDSDMMNEHADDASTSSESNAGPSSKKRKGE